MSYEQELKAHYTAIRQRLYVKSKQALPMLVVPASPPAPVKGKITTLPGLNSQRLRKILRTDTIGEIIKSVIDETGINGDLIINKSRNKEVCMARFMVFERLSKAGWSTTKTAKIFEMDHSSILHGIRRIRANG